MPYRSVHQSLYMSFCKTCQDTFCTFLKPLREVRKICPVIKIEIEPLYYCALLSRLLSVECQYLCECLSKCQFECLCECLSECQFECLCECMGKRLCECLREFMWVWITMSTYTGMTVRISVWLCKCRAKCLWMSVQISVNAGKNACINAGGNVYECRCECLLDCRYECPWNSLCNW